MYINEAHSEIWPIGLSAGAIVESHKKIEDRIKCANDLKDQFKLQVPVYCDNMNNDFESKLAAWPIRCYAVDKNNKFAYINTPKNAEFDIEDFLDFLNKYNN